MTHRERVLAAVAHREADRVPMDLGGSLASGIVAEAYPALRKFLGLPALAEGELRRYTSLAHLDRDVREALDVDILHAPCAFGGGSTIRVLAADRFIDEWGVQWHKPEHGHYYVEKAPFETEATPTAVARFPWSAAADIINWGTLVDTLRTMRANTDCAISLELRGRVMSIGQFLCGFENWMVDLAENEPFVEALLERTTQIQIECNDLLLRRVGDLVDIVYTSDDLGGQNGPLISMGTFKRLFRPHFERLWSGIRKTTKAVLMHHCCGSIRPFIGDFIELGVQALNPIQVSAADMDPARLKAEFGKDLTFWGGVDTRDVLPRGTTQEVREEVRRRIMQMAGGGGFVLAAVHNIQPEVPPANIVELFRAGREFGSY